MDFKKLKKSSSKKLKGGLGFFLSPREEGKETNEKISSTSKDAFVVTNTQKCSDWPSDSLKLDNDIDASDKDYIDSIPVIPSLEDFVEDDFTSQIAKAPLIGVKKIATYKELENDILRHSAFASFEEVNLRVLIRLLHPESLLNEPDTQWTKDGLFHEMVSKINENKM